MGLASCSDFLDKKSTAYDSDGFYQSEQGLDDGVTGVYRLIPYEQNWKVPQAVMQDVYSPYGLMADENVTISAGPGCNPDNSYVNSYWSGHWAIVARANNVIAGAKITFDDLFDPNADCSDKYKRRLAEAYVVRDYAYYNLVQAYGDIPFFPTAVTVEQYTEPRHDKKEIADHIIAELQQLAEAEILPFHPEQLGRVGNGAIYLLISRWGLLGGSHDFGGQADHYFQIAADAAQKVMQGAGLANKFEDLFSHEGQAKSDVRNEILFEYNYSAEATPMNTHKMRFGHTSRTIGGSSVRFPSVFLEMSFEDKLGNRIDESPIYDITKPYLNRDPRMKHTMLMHGDTIWYNHGTQAAVMNCYDKNSRQYPNPRKAGAWYSANNIDVTGTGASFAWNGNGKYWNKYNEDQSEGFADSSIDLIVMRAAEAYLTYAEAKIEMNSLDQTVYDAINAVRTRAGMPKFASSREGDQDKMRQIVRRERRVELGMEGVLLTDYRRWKIGDLLNAGPIYGQPVSEVKYTGLTKADMPTFKTTPRHDLNDIPDFSAVKDKYTSRDPQRFWADRFMWWPIPRKDLDRNPNLTNPEGY